MEETVIILKSDAEEYLAEVNFNLRMRREQLRRSYSYYLIPKITHLRHLRRRITNSLTNQ